jgi:replication-associated recombination protein RarA
MNNTIDLKPKTLKECLIHSDSMKLISKCNFELENVLFVGRAGVGKTLICKLLKSEHKNINYIENVDKNFDPIRPCIATSNNLKLKNDKFDKIITIHPLSKMDLLKTLSDLLKNEIINSKISLLDCINLKYPNINKIILEYRNENSILL